jgi:rod shape-determining protein MreC
LRRSRRNNAVDAMSDRRRTRTVLAALVVSALVLLSLDYRQGDTGSIAVLQRGALAVFAPLQEGFATVVRPVGNFFGAVGELGSLRDQVEQLEVDNAALRDQLGSQAELALQNAELRALLAMRERLGFNTTGAQVIAQPPSSFEFSVLIDAGSDDGLAPNMAVITADGLAGKLTEVTPSNARVQLLTSPNANYAARIVETRDDGLLRGRGSRPFQLSVLNPETELPPGAQVVTRAFCGTAIPDGIPIGVVAGDRPVPGNRFVPVQPLVDFSRLNFVQVVLNAPVAPCELPTDDLAEDPARPRPSSEPTAAEPSEQPPVEEES